MKIGIEAQRIFRVNKHGMDFVALECIKELQKIDITNEYFIFVNPGKDICLSETNNFHIITLNSSFYPYWEQILLPRAVKKYDLDMLHCTSNTAPIFCSVPLILTLHDIIFLEKRSGGNKSLYQTMGWYYRRLVVPKIIPKCKKIITVSAFECERIKKTLNLSQEQIMFIYNGYNNYFRKIEDVQNVTSKYTKEKDFIFFLGNTDPKKNVPRTLRAYALYLKKSKIKRHLLIADIKNDVLQNILKENNIEDIKSYITILDYVPNNDLVYIYNSAFAFLYTSLRESFGIPILEGMACGTPVIVGNTSAMPEIAGEGGLKVDPYNEKEISDALILLESDKVFYENLCTYGLTQVKRFSWINTATNLLNLYKDIE